MINPPTSLDVKPDRSGTVANSLMVVAKASGPSSIRMADDGSLYIVEVVGGAVQRILPKTPTTDCKTSIAADAGPPDTASDTSSPDLVDARIPADAPSPTDVADTNAGDSFGTGGAVASGAGGAVASGAGGAVASGAGGASGTGGQAADAGALGTGGNTAGGSSGASSGCGCRVPGNHSQNGGGIYAFTLGICALLASRKRRR